MSLKGGLCCDLALQKVPRRVPWWPRRLRIQYLAWELPQAMWQKKKKKKKKLAGMELGMEREQQVVNISVKQI